MKIKVKERFTGFNKEVSFTTWLITKLKRGNSKLAASDSVEDQVTRLQTFCAFLAEHAIEKGTLTIPQLRKCLDLDRDEQVSLMKKGEHLNEDDK
tara:strand:+ start:271 stop:555 length:285 start_codon:yes stop_codon:yes gene_type:complete